MPIFFEALPTLSFCLGLILALLALSFLIRIILTWYPEVNPKSGFWLISYLLTEPFLSITRRFINPIGGVDITPIIWFGLSSLVRELLVGPQGILSQILLKKTLGL